MKYLIAFLIAALMMLVFIIPEILQIVLVLSIPLIAIFGVVFLMEKLIDKE